MQNKGSDTLGSLKTLLTGSNNKFDYKNPGLNGKTETVETLGSNLSIKIRKEDSPMFDKRQSKFSPTIKNQPRHNSNFSNMMFPSNENVAEIPSERSERKIVKNARKSEHGNNEFYKKVLLNNALPGNRKPQYEENKEIEMKIEKKFN